MAPAITDVKRLRLFRTAGLKVSLFATAEEYLAHPDRAEVACLLIAVRLSGMGGLELLEKGQTETPKPCLVITAHEDERARNGALAEGAVGFFRKPVDIRPYKNVIDYELLPYHRYGESKYRFLGRVYEMEDFNPPASETVQRLRALIDEAFGHSSKTAKAEPGEGTT